MLGTALFAQSPRAPHAAPRTLSVYLITVGEGAQIWEKFGHNSLWFRDSAARIDEAYNWGTFDFKAPDFVWRFVTGDTKYWVDMYPSGRRVIEFFAVDQHRSVDVQLLNLTDAQAHKALDLARQNALPANKFYRYDYFLDNCSTRVRDLLDSALDGALKSATQDVTYHSFRSEAVRLTDDLGFAQFGITSALGRPADRPITRWEDAFVPMRLRDIVRTIRVPGDGGTRSLVAEERNLYTAADHAERKDDPSIWIIPLVIGLVIAADLFGIGIIGLRTRVVDVAFHAEVVLWSLATGVVGAAILFAWMFTRHAFWANNENLLVMNPLSLWLALLALLSVRNKRWLRPAAITAALLALCSAAALVLHGIPGAGQDNVAVLALTVPAHFAAAFGLWRRHMAIAAG
ncbi:MAG TPA: DUF4105 domain-containing protein [Gemmatimonadaceae bacterium]